MARVSKRAIQCLKARDFVHYSRPGGSAPLCHPEDITPAMVQAWVERHRPAPVTPAASQATAPAATQITAAETLQ